MPMLRTLRRFLDAAHFERGGQPIGLLAISPTLIEEFLVELRREMPMMINMDQQDREALGASVFFVGVRAFNNADGRFGWEKIERHTGQFDRQATFYDAMEAGVRKLLGLELIRLGNQRRFIGTMVSQSAATFPLALATLQVIASHRAWDLWKNPNEPFVTEHVHNHHFTPSLRKMLSNAETLSAVATVVARQVALRAELKSENAQDLATLYGRKPGEFWRARLGVEKPNEQKDILALLFDFETATTDFEWRWDGTLKLALPQSFFLSEVPLVVDRLRIQLGHRNVFFHRKADEFHVSETVFYVPKEGEEDISINAEFREDGIVKSEIVYEGDFPAELVAVFGENTKQDLHAKSEEVILVPRPGFVFEDVPKGIWNHVVTKRGQGPTILRLRAPDGEVLDWVLFAHHGYTHVEIESPATRLKAYGQRVHRSPLSFMNTNPEKVLLCTIQGERTTEFELDPGRSQTIHLTEGAYRLSVKGDGVEVEQKLLVSNWEPTITEGTVNFAPHQGAILGRRLRRASPEEFMDTGSLTENGRSFAAIALSGALNAKGWIRLENWDRRVEYLKTSDSTPEDFPADISTLKRGGRIRIHGVPGERVHLEYCGKLVRKDRIRSYGSVDIRVVELWHDMDQASGRPSFTFRWPSSPDSQPRHCTLTDTLNSRPVNRHDGNTVEIQGTFPEGTVLFALDVWQPWTKPSEFPMLGTENGFARFPIPDTDCIVVPVSEGMRQSGAFLISQNAVPEGLGGLSRALCSPPNPLAITGLVEEFLASCDDQTFDQLLSNIEVYGGRFLRISEAMRWAAGAHYVRALVESSREDEVGLRARRWKRVLEVECQMTPLFLTPQEIAPYLQLPGDFEPLADAQAGLLAATFDHAPDKFPLLQKYFRGNLDPTLSDEDCESLRYSHWLKADQISNPRLAALLPLRSADPPEKSEPFLPLKPYFNYGIPHLIKNECCVVEAARTVLDYRNSKALENGHVERLEDALTQWRRAPQLMDLWLTYLPTQGNL